MKGKNASIAFQKEKEVIFDAESSTKPQKNPT